ncbi:hypothetical protein Bbelb_117350 [Branchiostoma belcheri]|nr:hypothetical protein Bbelb_117350 [Branchiostoma belcheri]
MFDWEPRVPGFDSRHATDPRTPPYATEVEGGRSAADKTARGQEAPHQASSSGAKAHKTPRIRLEGQWQSVRTLSGHMAEMLGTYHSVTGNPGRSRCRTWGGWTRNASQPAAEKGQDAGQQENPPPPPGNPEQQQQAQVQEGHRVLAGAQARLLPQANQQGLADLRTEFAALRQKINRLRGTSVDGIKDELIQHDSRPKAAFDPKKAVGLMETLSQQATQSNHPKAEEYKAILQQLRPLEKKEYFKDIILDLFGSQVVKQVNKSIASFVKSHAAIHHAEKGASGSGQTFQTSRQTGNRYTPYRYRSAVEAVSAGRMKASADSLLFRDPTTFRAGEIHQHAREWKKILGKGDHSAMIIDWVENGVSMLDFIRPFTDVTRYVGQGHYQTKCDGKSGHDHVLISEGSKALVGFQWGGVWVVPDLFPHKYWWALIQQRASKVVRVACAGQPILYFPSRKGGWVLRPTNGDLWAFLVEREDKDLK